MVHGVPHGKHHLTLVPLESMDEFYLPLTAFDFSPSAKNGCAGFSNVQNDFQICLNTNLKESDCFEPIFMGFMSFMNFATLPVYPSNTQFEAHLGEFLQNGYKVSLGNIEVKFPWRDGTRIIKNFTVGCDDGLTKLILMFAIVGFVVELELAEKDDGTLRSLLQSFRSIRCSYTYFENPALHFLHSLRSLFAWSCFF